MSKTVEHPFGTIKAWMGATHFKRKRMENVATEMALHVLAYNMTRVMAIWTSPETVEGFSDKFGESGERQWAKQKPRRGA